MKVHHLNCATMRPYGGRLVSGTGSVFGKAEMICHCLLIETGGGLVLVDSGLGTGDVADPDRTLNRRWQQMCRPVLDESETAVRQIERMGYATGDVRHVVLTHLDLDHAGGLRDFPDAKVHVLAQELAAARSASTPAERTRYPRGQWEHGPDWVTHEPDGGEEWFGFQAVRDLPGVPEEILLVPLIGHTRGHTGVAVRTGDRWLLHAGDAYFFHGEMAPDPHCTPVLRMMQRRVETLRELRLANQDRLRELVRSHGDKVDVFSAHDAVELRRLEGQEVDAG